MADIEQFISANLLRQDVDVYCGGEDKFRGTVAGCGEGVVTLRTGEDVLTHVSTDKIVAIWRRAQEKSGRK
jgi:hypothetical protein